MTRAKLRDYGYYAVLWLVSLFFAAPVAWIVLASFKTRSDILAVPPKLIFSPTLSNYVDLFHRNTARPTDLQFDRAFALLRRHCGSGVVPGSVLLLAF